MKTGMRTAKACGAPTPQVISNDRAERRLQNSRLSVLFRSDPKRENEADQPGDQEDDGDLPAATYLQSFALAFL
jgi:hypothetical protein